MKKSKVLINLILIIFVIGAFSQSLATEGTNEVVPEPPQTEEVAPPETEIPDNNEGGNNEIENTTPNPAPDNTTPPNTEM